MTACYMCDNAHTNPELNDDNDLSYISFGESGGRHRFMIRSGDARPTVILFEECTDVWHLLGCYTPNFCPNCGRKLIENTGP